MENIRSDNQKLRQWGNDEYLRADDAEKEKKCKPFAQPYRDFENKIEPTLEQRKLARWVNHKAIFNTVNFSDYKKVLRN